MNRPVAWCLAVSLCIGAAAAEDLKDGPALPRPEMIGRLKDKAVSESSGLARSPKHANLFWTHNDGGHAAKLFALDAAGVAKGSVEVAGAKNTDWEDLAVDAKGRLVIADVGDNGARRAQLALHRLDEPALNADGTVDAAKPASAATFPFKYPDGPCDAEAAFVRGGYAYLVTKEPKRARVYRVPMGDEPPAADAPPAVAQLIGSTDKLSLVTAADLSPNGKYLAILSYARVAVIEYPRTLEATDPKEGGTPLVFTGVLRKRTALLGQAEAIAWDGADLLITTEGGELWRMRGVIKPEARPGK